MKAEPRETSNHLRRIETIILDNSYPRHTVWECTVS